MYVCVHVCMYKGWHLSNQLIHIVKMCSLLEHCKCHFCASFMDLKNSAMNNFNVLQLSLLTISSGFQEAASYVVSCES